MDFDIFEQVAWHTISSMLQYHDSKCLFKLEPFSFLKGIAIMLPSVKNIFAYTNF